MSANVRLEQRDNAHFLLFSRPQSGNSLSEELVQALHDALDAFENAGGRVLVIQGAGRNFCTGFDLSDIADMTDSSLLLRFVRIEQLLARIWAADYATIAVAQGRAIGAGADIFTACATRMASEGTSFSFPGAGFGLILGTRRLAARVGSTNAQRLVSSGEAIDGATAARMGLVSDLLEPEALDCALQRAIDASLRLDEMTFKSARKALGVAEGLDIDLAALVRSAARPGLRERIIDYRSRSQAARHIENQPG